MFVGFIITFGKIQIKMNSGDIFLLIIVVIFSGIYSLEYFGLKKINDKLTGNGFDLNTKIKTGKYVAGHSQIDNNIPFSAIIPKNDSLYIFEYKKGLLIKTPKEIAIIKKDAIKNISVEDSAMVQKKVTAGRLLAIGVLAFAFQKKTKPAYLVIEWSDGRFEHETYFEFSDENSIQSANTARNKLLKVIY